MPPCTSPSHSRASALLPALTAVFACILPLILAEVPLWWSSRSVVMSDVSGQPVAASDFAAATRGAQFVQRFRAASKVPSHSPSLCP